MPKEFEIFQNYPNPFNPTTKIGFDLVTESIVTLKVYDVLGREIATLIDRSRISAGSHSVEFNADKLTSQRVELSTGVYFYRISAEGTGGDAAKFTQMKKMLLLR